MVSLILYEQLAIIHIVASLYEMCHFSLTAFKISLFFSNFIVIQLNVVFFMFNLLWSFVFLYL